MNAKYYIGTGAKNCFYTLRYRYSENVYVRTETGVESAGVAERDYHVRNLSTNRDEAIAKAREITNQGLTAEFEVADITRRSEVDWSVFQAGKYTGKSIHEVAAIDKNYLVWACENLTKSKQYEKTVELAKSLVEHELANNKSVRDAAVMAEVQAAKIRSERSRPLVEVLRRSAGQFCASVADELEQGHKISDRASDIVIDIFAKAHGRRNSKAYQEAYEKAWTIFEQPNI